MNPTTRKQSSSKITIDTPELMQMLTCGRVTAVEVGTRAGARIKIGKRVLWNVGKIQDGKYAGTVAERISDIR